MKRNGMEPDAFEAGLRSIANAQKEYARMTAKLVASSDETLGDELAAIRRRGRALPGVLAVALARAEEEILGHGKTA